jgi:phosphatidylinositol alpha-1,6-mannosyltransferase
MNTLLLLPALFASDGGIERIARLYVRAAGELARPGDQVEVIVLNDRQPPDARLDAYRTPALRPPVVCGRRKLAFVWQVLKRARRTDRIICGHVNLLRVAQLARWLNPAIETWLVAHGVEVWRPFSAGEQRMLQETDRILCVSDYTRRQIAGHCAGLAPGRLVVQANALDPQFTASAVPGATATSGLLLVISRLVQADSYKGVDHLIATLPEVRKTVPNARLRIIGDGNDRGRLEGLARAGGCAEAIEFLGRVSDADLRRNLAQCQVFALPSQGEGFGLVYLEALAHGKPCIAANAGGAPEVIDASSGYLVPYGDVPALAEACSAALRRTWDPRILQARAASFSYEIFRQRLATIWSPASPSHP